MDGGGWQIRWNDGRTERVAAFLFNESESAYEPFVLSDDQTKLIPALIKSPDFTLQHPHQFTRGT